MIAYYDTLHGSPIQASNAGALMLVIEDSTAKAIAAEMTKDGTRDSFRFFRMTEISPEDIGSFGEFLTAKRKEI